jgi:hypothetical protein
VLGIAAAAGTMLAAAAIPASATPTEANYGAFGYGSSPGAANQSAYNNALAKAEADGFSSSQCVALGRPMPAQLGPQGPLSWEQSWGVQCTTQPAPGTVNLNRYYNYYGPQHMSTTGSAPAGYYLDGSLGWLYSSQVAGTAPLYMCQVVASTDSFTSPDVNCEGQSQVGLLGYIYTAPPAGLASRVVRRCTVGGYHFDSNDLNCEGQTAEGILGYTLD